MGRDNPKIMIHRDKKFLKKITIDMVFRSMDRNEPDSTNPDPSDTESY